VARSTALYRAAPESALNLELMRQIDRIHLDQPVYGSPRMTAELRRHGWHVNRKRVSRLMRKMGIEAIYQKPRTSIPGKGHRVFPYLLRDREIRAPDEVWCADITYVPMACGFMYLVAVMDWFSRYVLAWRLSNTLDSAFCLDALTAALDSARESPQIFNTDQGAQFTAEAFVERVLGAGASMSMDGRGRWLDNRFIERLWRSYKYEDVYLRAYESPAELEAGTGNWFAHYNESRPHQALDYRTPREVYRGKR
jgi:putative transposase